MLVVGSCAAPKNFATLTPFPQVTQVNSPPSSDLTEAARTVVTAIDQKRPDLLQSLIGDEGVAALGFASGASYKGYNNSEEIISAFSTALQDAQPVCAGFVPDAGTLPDKAIIVYRDLPIDWSGFGLKRGASEGVTIQLFNLEEGWHFVYITPFDFGSDSRSLGPLEDCPDGR
jgi:hypothetical protein